MFLTMTMALTATVVIGFGHPLPLMNHSKLELESSIPVNASLWNKTLDTSNYTDVLYTSSQRNNVTSNQTETPSFPETLETNSTLPVLGPPGNITNESRVVFACFYSLCAVDELADRLNKGGDEVAGHNAKHPLGPGK